MCRLFSVLFMISWTILVIGRQERGPSLSSKLSNWEWVNYFAILCSTIVFYIQRNLCHIRIYNDPILCQCAPYIRNYSQLIQIIKRNLRSHDDWMPNYICEILLLSHECVVYFIGDLAEPLFLFICITSFLVCLCIRVITCWLNLMIQNF